MTAVTIQGIKAIPYIPQKGQHYLSVNLAMADLSDVWDVCIELGFKPELVQLSHQAGTEIHALLWHEQTDGSLLGSTDLDDKIDRLADRIDPAAIRHVYGGHMVA